MRKVLVLLVLLLSLTGCGEEKKNDNQVVEPKLSTITCKTDGAIEGDGYSVETNYKINYSDDYVDNVETIETVVSDDEDILDSMESYLDSTYTTAGETYGGYTYNVSRDGNTLTATVTIDYNVMDLDKYVEDYPTMESYIEDGKFLVDGITEIYESLGTTCEDAN